MSKKSETREQKPKNKAVKLGRKYGEYENELRKERAYTRKLKHKNSMWDD